MSQKQTQSCSTASLSGSLGAGSDLWPFFKPWLNKLGSSLLNSWHIYVEFCCPSNTQAVVLPDAHSFSTKSVKSIHSGFISPINNPERERNSVPSNPSRRVVNFQKMYNNSGTQSKSESYVVWVWHWPASPTRWCHTGSHWRGGKEHIPDTFGPRVRFQSRWSERAVTGDTSIWHPVANPPPMTTAVLRPDSERHNLGHISQTL